MWSSEGKFPEKPTQKHPTRQGSLTKKAQNGARFCELSKSVIDLQLTSSTLRHSSSLDDGDDCKNRLVSKRERSTGQKYEARQKHKAT